MGGGGRRGVPREGPCCLCEDVRGRDERGAGETGESGERGAMLSTLGVRGTSVLLEGNGVVSVHD